jgi:replicative superfamily II helicase
MTKEERLLCQRNKRKENGNAYTNKYEKTFSGFLMRKYRNMVSRVSGVQKQKAHLYLGKLVLDKEDFYEWAKNSPELEAMWQDWVESDYDRKLCPTVDRIDASIGYFVSNMRWLTHSENSRLGAFNRNYGSKYA